MNKEKNVFRYKWMASIFLWGAFLFASCQPSPATPAAPTTDQVGTMVAATLTGFPTSTIPPTATPEIQTYSNPDYGFAFDYPPGWEVTETVISPGTTLSNRSMNRYDISAGSDPVLLIEVTKGNDWILEMTAYPTTPSTCGGGMGPVPDDQSYQPLQILGRKAARLRVEDGLAWNPPEHSPISTLPVWFYKLTGECSESWPDSAIPAGQVVFLMSYSPPEKPYSLNLIYYSNQFTDENLRNRTIDYAVVGEMDQIVQSLRLTR